MKLGRMVAIKFLPPELTRDEHARRRFLREAHAAAKLEHPNICTVYDVGEADDEQVWIAMACYEGETLKSIIENERLSVDESIRIARQIADGLAKAHASGIVHRDVKPENVMITKDGVAKILDFGLAKTVDTTTLTNPGAMLGTIAYMSPEQLKGGEVDPESDVWSLGVILYEMLSGVRPFHGEYLQAVAYAILNEEHVAISELCPDIPKGLAKIVERMLAKDPAKRFADGEEVVAALDSLTGNGSASGAHTLTRLRVSSRTRRRLTRAAIWCAALVAVIAVALRLGETTPGVQAVPGSLPTQVVIGILPFEDISEALPPRVGPGFAHAMSARLGEVRDLQVVFSERFDREKDSSFRTDEALVRERGANVLVHGTLQQSDEILRATWTMVDLDGRQLAGNVAESAASRLMSLQDAVGQQILAALDRADTLSPTPRVADAAFSEVRYIQAMGYLTRYDSEMSVDEAIRILEPLGNSATVQAALGRAYYAKFLLTGREREWADRALQASQAAALALAASDADDPQVHRTLGEIHTATSEYEEAERELRHALELRPDDADIRLAYADLLAKTRRPDDAEKEYRDAIAIRPANWAGHNRLGSFYLFKMRLDDAMASFREAERITPDNTYVLTNIGVTYYFMGQHEEAVEAYEESNRVHPTGVAFNNLGTLLYYLGRFDEAADVFRRATALTPGSFRAWTGYADALRWSSNEKSEADAAYRHAIDLAEVNLELNPRDAQTLAVISTCHAKIGDADRAIATALLAVETSPDDPHVNYYAGVAMEVAGDRAGAVKLIRHALELGYTNDELLHDPELKGFVSETGITYEKGRGV
jgi:serine/threonine-protein kinase